MNREIKFRFWLEVPKRMCDWETAKKECDRLSLLELDGFIHIQYTGLKDKNGVEIYEGDILLCPNGKKHDIRFGEFTFGNDDYGDRCIGFSFSDKEPFSSC